MAATTYVRRQRIAPRAAPPPMQGLARRIRESLFDGWRASLLTLAAVALLALLLPPLLRFLIFDAVWSAPDGAPCRAPGAGACWAFIAHKLPYFTYGSYPLAERWRVDLTMALGGALIIWLLWLDAARRRVAAILFFGVYPLASFALLSGAPSLGLPRVRFRPLGRRHGQPPRRHRRHRRVAAARHSAGARAPLGRCRR